MRRLIAGLLFVATLTVPLSAMAEEKKPGRLAGRLTYQDGKPFANGVVHMFRDAVGPPPVPEKYWRIPDEVFHLDENGAFNVELAAGRYFIGAIMRKKENVIGPLTKGDYYLVSRDDAGNSISYQVHPVMTTDAGVLSNSTSFDPSVVKIGKGVTAITGRIIGEDGKPVSNVLVFAFLTPEVSGRPLFSSERSDKEGRFLLRVHKGGTYYLSVRTFYGGGPPSKDSVLDGYREAPLAEVTVETGGVAIGVINKMFAKRGPGSKRRAPEQGD